MSDTKKASTLERLREALASHRQLTDLHKAAKAEADVIRDEQIIPLTAELGLKSTTFVTEGGLAVQATFPAQGEKTIINEEKLKRAVGAAVWSKITTPQLDPAKLNNWLNEAGLLEAEKLSRMTTVSAVTEVRPGPKPSPRYKVMGPAKTSDPAPVPASTPPAIVAIDIPEDI